MASFSTTLNDP